MGSVRLPGGACGVVVDRDVMIPMRDGVGLAADIYRPAEGDRAVNEPLPVILERTPYDKAGTALSDITLQDRVPLSKPEIAHYFASHGYVVVMQDCRGRYKSEGSFRKYVHEAEDGCDTVEWLAQQSWCDGRVATMGLSYCAHTQSALACLAPSALASQFLDSGGFSSAYHGGIRQGGAFELKQATWAFKHAMLSPETRRNPARRAALEAQDIRAWFRQMPWQRGHSPVSAAPEYEDYLFEQWERGEFSDYWRQLAYFAQGHYETYADVPMVHMSSWYDPYVRTATDNFIGLSRRKRSPVHLIMGPWTHGRRSETHAGEVDFGTEATLDGQLAESYYELRRRWFDYTLKGGSDNPLSRGRVAIFIMGGGSGHRDACGRLEHGGHWRWADDWPLPGTSYRPLYLHESGRLDFEPPEVHTASRSFDYDPLNPVPTVGGAIASGKPVMEAGAFDQCEAARFFGSDGSGRDLCERPDVLSFSTEPLQHDLEVVGPIRVRLWVASDCPDTDFTVKLIDWYSPSEEYPRGFAMNLTDGILRMRYRNSWSHAEMMEPGKEYEIEIEPFPTANLFIRGHRIRVDISSSNYPHFDLNSNTGEPEGRWRSTRVARNTVYCDAIRPSHLILPIAPSQPD